jgi:hypothetical protein
LSKGKKLGLANGRCRRYPIAIRHRIAREDPVGLGLTSGGTAPRQKLTRLLLGGVEELVAWAAFAGRNRASKAG